jgi:hypothetical protein
MEYSAQNEACVCASEIFLQFVLHMLCCQHAICLKAVQMKWQHLFKNISAVHKHTFKNRY